MLLQIRVGDNIIQQQHNISLFNRKVLPVLNRVTDCAEAVEAKVKTASTYSNERFLWYLMSDSVAVREHMTATYGTKVLSKSSLFTRVEKCQLVAVHHWQLSSTYLILTLHCIPSCFVYSAHNSTIQNLMQGMFMFITLLLPCYLVIIVV
jgi:hypothetical protein